MTCHDEPTGLGAVNAKDRASKRSFVPIQIWRSNVCLAVTVLVIGLGLAVALALGLRSLTPRRTPDRTAANLTWAEYGDGSAVAVDDGYIIRLSEPGQRAWVVADQPVAEFDFELGLRALIPSEEADYGVLYRYQDSANYYLFAIGSDGYYTIAAARNGELSPLQVWQQWPHVRRGGASNILRVRCEATLCRFHINGEFTAEIIDDSFLTGRVGIWAQSFSDATLEVIFYRVRLWQSD